MIKREQKSGALAGGRNVRQGLPPVPRGAAASTAPPAAPSPAPPRGEKKSARVAIVEEPAEKKTGATLPIVECKRGDVECKRGKRLTFVNCNLSEVLDAVAAAENHPGLFHNTFWGDMLTNAPAKEFAALLNRTIQYWVGVFNRWQEMRRASSNPRFVSVNATQLGDILNLRKDKVNCVVELFDPEGFRRMKTSSFSAASASKVMVNMPEVIAAGVFTSRLVPTGVKINVCFGLCDFDDSGYLDVHEFSMFLRAFIYGIGGALGIDQQVMPCLQDIRSIADRLIVRIPVSVRRGKCKNVGDREYGVPYCALRDWCIGDASEEDPLALPYKLTMKRFCPTRDGGVVDEYDEQLMNFRLCHSQTAKLKEDVFHCPRHGRTSNNCKYLTRQEVLLAHQAFQSATSGGRVRLSAQELRSIAAECRLGSDEAAQKRLLGALEALANKLRPGQDVYSLDVFDLYKELCPCAQAKHLSMFEAWFEHFELQKQDHVVREPSAGAAGGHVASLQRPVTPLPPLPPDQLLYLEQEFERLDEDGSGCISVDEIIVGWGWSARHAIDTMDLFDLCGDGYIDKIEFVRMMIPAEYSMPEAYDKFETLERVAASQMREQQAEVDRYTQPSRAPGVEPGKIALPPTLWPPAPDLLVTRWADLYSRFDKDPQGTVRIVDLQASGLIGKTACVTVTRILSQDLSKEAFGLRDFVDAMCKAHKYRSPPIRSRGSRVADARARASQ